MPRASAGVRSARYRAYGPQAKTIFDQMNLPEPMRPDFEFLSEIKDRTGVSLLIRDEHPVGSNAHTFILSALDLIMIEHGTRRRHSGERESRHLLRCFLILWKFCGVRSPERLVAMLLHDLSETFRSRWPISKIERMFGSVVALHVEFLTKARKKKGVSKRKNERDYYKIQLANAPREVIEEKGVDVLDNLITLWKRGIERMGRKIDDVIRYVLPLLRRHKLHKLLRAIVMVLDFIRHKLRNDIAFAH